MIDNGVSPPTSCAGFTDRELRDMLAQGSTVSSIYCRARNYDATMTKARLRQILAGGVMA